MLARYLALGIIDIFTAGKIIGLLETTAP